jgi:hypothetical protein
MAYEPTTSVGRRVLFRPQRVLGAGAAWGTTACMMLISIHFIALCSLLEHRWTASPRARYPGRETRA